MVAQRGTVLIPSGTELDPQKKHLFVVMTRPAQFHDKGWSDAIVLTPICTAVGKFDGTCCLWPGDHPFIVRQSYVKYSFSAIKSASSIDHGIKAGDFKIKDDMRAEIFVRMYQGLLDSRRTSFEVKQFIASLGA